MANWRHIHRRMKHMNERRQVEASMGQGVKVRRGLHNGKIPNPWDDYTFDFPRRSWKRYRKSQYKIKEE